MSQKHLISRAVSWLLAQRYMAQSVSSKEVKFSSEAASLNCFPDNRSVSFLINFPIIILNRELGALAQGLLVPVHREVSSIRGTSQHHLLFS